MVEYKRDNLPPRRQYYSNAIGNTGLPRNEVMAKVDDDFGRPRRRAESEHSSSDGEMPLTIRQQASRAINDLIKYRPAGVQLQPIQNRQ